ncbi:head decoration protein [Trabulsiella guamensis ATCC 49490]|uniref:Head decoration protein n=1 Tax=Trabulsiella guamensis ATCC 49490 TaxID=1005994 RepID=A0A085AFP5_9ENTR|nr:head decoration protein [Trabulsiella guamensis]KFC09040.1 head decoration protein [Trabulsiella guamensis ATCC 49490]
MITTVTETRQGRRVFAGNDEAHTAKASSGITVATPALTPLMLNTTSGKLVVWDGAASGTAVGVLALALEGTEQILTYYKSGTFATESLVWPTGVDAVKKANAFVGCSISHA